MKKYEFVKLPSSWITDKKNPKLKLFKWDRKGGNVANAHLIAALIIYIVVLHNANFEPNSDYTAAGFAKLSYVEFEEITGLSRASISGGIKTLEKFGLLLINRMSKTNVYEIVGYNAKSGWAKLPYKNFYSDGVIRLFGDHFHLRQENELNALKMYFLIAAFRDNKNNHSSISYDAISYYSGIARNNIQAAISLLVNFDLVRVIRVNESLEPEQSNINFKVVNMYRLTGLSNSHLGNLNQEKLIDISNGF